MNNSIGNKLKQLRKQKGLSQEQLSELLHMSQSTYARIENGESNSWSLHLDKITEFFEIKPEELFDEENVVINLNQQGGQFNNAIVINLLSEKLIEQYENRIKEQSEIIAKLMSK
jgi:transcriptional regulator with XRE-family HTH domain